MGSAASKQAARKLPKQVKNDVNLARTGINKTKLTENIVNSVEKQDNVESDGSSSNVESQVFIDRLKDLGEVKFTQVKTNYKKENSMLSTIKKQKELLESEKKQESSEIGLRSFLSPEQIRKWLEARGTETEKSILKELNISDSVVKDLKVLELPNNLAKESEDGQIFIQTNTKEGKKTE